MLPSNERWREAIAGTAVGYGRAATGGKGGQLRVVSNLNDSGAGSLRAAVETPGPAWITSSVSGTIPLATEIQVGSDKTIDGRGSKLTLSRYGLNFGRWQALGAPTANAIVTNLLFFDTVGNCQLRISEMSSDVWIEHCTFSKMVDESVYVGSYNSSNTDPAPTRVTVSNSRWNGLNSVGSSDKVLLISDSGLPKDAAATVTMYRNWYNRMYVRHPLGRYAKVHSLNNFYDAPIIGVDGRTDLQFLSENDILNRNVSGSVPMFKVWLNGYVPDDPRGAKSLKVVNPLLLNGATFEQVNAAGIFVPGYPYTPAVADAALQSAIVASAGWLDVNPLAEQINALNAVIANALATLDGSSGTRAAAILRQL